MPPVKRLLPPRSSALAFSSTSTWAPASHAARAAVKAALPAPTTTTSLNSSDSSTLSLRSGYHAGHPRVLATAPDIIPSRLDAVLRCRSYCGGSSVLEQMPERHAKSGHDLATRQFILSRQDAHVRGRVIHVDLTFLGGDYPHRLDSIVEILTHLGQHVLKDVIGTDHFHGKVGHHLPVDG